MKLARKELSGLIFFLLIPLKAYFAQEIADFNQLNKVNFVKSISSFNDIENQNIFNKLTSLIFGNENLDLQKPISVIAEDSTKLVILDQGLQSLVSFNLKTNSNEEIDYDLKYPSLAAISRFEQNKYLFTDSKLNKIFIYDHQQKSIECLNDSIKLNKPTGIGYIKSKNEIWVSETGSHSILVLDKLGNIKSRIGQRGVEKSEFNFPTSIWTDKHNKVFVVDALNFRIQVFDYDGNFLSMFGEQGDATGYLARPKGVATDSEGNIYVVDALFHTVQIFNTEGIYLSNFGSQGKADGNFWLPNGIYIDEFNRIYIADSYNSRIQIFQLILCGDEEN